MTTLLFINLVVLALAAWVSLFILVPSCAASRCRYRLWNLRDQIVDQIRHGEFVDSQPAQELVLITELAIEDAPDITAVNAFLFRIATGDLRLVEDPLGLETLGPQDSRSMEPHIQRLDHILLTKAFLGSPTGWIAALVMTPFFLISLFKARGGRPAVTGATSKGAAGGPHPQQSRQPPPGWRPLPVRLNGLLSGLRRGNAWPPSTLLPATPSTVQTVARRPREPCFGGDLESPGSRPPKACKGRARLPRPARTAADGGTDHAEAR